MMPTQQDDAADGVDDQVAVAGGQGPFAAPEPDEEGRGKGHHLPEQEQAQVIAAVDGAERAGNVEPGGHMLLGIVNMQAVQGADHGHQAHDQGKDRGEPVDPAEDQLPVHELVGAELSVQVHCWQTTAAMDSSGTRNRYGLRSGPRIKGRIKCAEHQDQGGMDERASHWLSPRLCLLMELSLVEPLQQQ